MEDREEQGPKPDETGTPGDVDRGASDDSAAADQPPALPAEDGSPLGDTDQHSDA